MKRRIAWSVIAFFIIYGGWALLRHVPPFSSYWPYELVAIGTAVVGALMMFFKTGREVHRREARE